jgi:hypothetical protein
LIPVGDIKQSAICGNSAVGADVWNVNHSVHQQTLRHPRPSNRIVYDEKRIFERSAVVQLAIDARAQKYPDQRRYQYQPFAGREDEFRFNEANWDRYIKDYTTRDLNI